MLKYLFYILINAVIIVSEILIKDAGVAYIDKEDIGMIFYLNVQNICHNTIYLCAEMVECCEEIAPNIRDCNSMHLIGRGTGVLKAKRSVNLTLIYPNLYLRNRKGTCTISVHYNTNYTEGYRETRREICFNSDTLMPGCSSLKMCQTRDLSLMHGCTQVDCTMKYSGYRSFFNTRTQLCEEVECCMSDPKNCLPDVGYDYTINKCKDLEFAVTTEDLADLEIGIHGAREVTPNLLGNAICHHGSVCRKTGGCFCEFTWLSSLDDALLLPQLYRLHLCNIQVDSWADSYKNRIRKALLLILLMILLIILKLLLIMCLLNWCYIRRHKKAVCRKSATCICTDPKVCQSNPDYKKMKAHSITGYCTHTKPLSQRTSTTSSRCPARRSTTSSRCPARQSTTSSRCPAHRTNRVIYTARTNLKVGSSQESAHISISVDQSEDERIPLLKETAISVESEESASDEEIVMEEDSDEGEPLEIGEEEGNCDVYEDSLEGDRVKTNEQYTISTGQSEETRKTSEDTYTF